MITQTESTLTTGEYSELETLRTGGAYALTLRRLNFSWTTLSGSETNEDFDLGVTSTQLVRALAGSTIIVEGRQSDEGSWTNLSASITGASSSVTPGVVTSGTTIRVFYYTGSDIKYKESTDDGSTWGSATTVLTVANVAFLAPVSTTRLHYATFDDYNTRFHRADYSGSWSATNSALYWQQDIFSFDAETIGDYDVLLFDSEGPKRYATCRQGIYAFRVKGNTWGDPYEVDIVDEYEVDVTERRGVMLAKIDGRLFATYLAQDSGFEAACFAQSSTGQFWQYRQPLGSIAVKCKLATLGPYAYLVNGDYLYRSAATPLVGNSTVEYDVSSRVSAYEFNKERMHQSRLTLDNDDGGLVDLTDFDRWQLVEQVGYWGAAGDALTVQIALTEVDSIDTGRGLPVSEVKVTARDNLAWMMDRTESDTWREFKSQTRHYDGFENVYDSATNKEILHSGMGYTYPRDGYWSTEESDDVEGEFELRLKSNNTEGLALCTIDKFLGHTIVQEGFKIPTAANNEWAGIAFRVIDEDNYWCAYYDQATDTIKLRQKQEGVWQAAVATTSTLSWSVATWYYLRVEARFSSYVVYYSTDGATWTQAFAYVDVNFTTDVLDLFREGYVGHAGYGYSDEDAEPGEPPAYVPPAPYTPPVLSYSMYEQFMVGTDNGMAYCDTETIVAGSVPTWTSANMSGKDVRGIVIRQENDEVWAVCLDNVYRTSLPVSAASSWTLMLSSAQIYSACGGGTQLTIRGGMQSSWLNPDKYWLMVAVKNSSWRTYVIITEDAFSSYTAYQVGTTGSFDNSGADIKVVHDGTENVLYMCAISGTYSGSLYKSTNGGTVWTKMQDNGAYGRFLNTCVHPSDPDYVMVGDSSKKIKVSVDGATSWAYEATISEDSRWGHAREDGVGVPMMYMVFDKRVEQFRYTVPDAQTATTYSAPFIDWHGAPVPSGVGLVAQDGVCVGWGTDNKFGYFIAVGKKEISSTGPEVMHTSDYGNYVVVTGNLQSVLPSATWGWCIGWEGGEWDE